jgi:hypothetical protein
VAKKAGAIKGEGCEDQALGAIAKALSQPHMGSQEQLPSI